MSDEFETPSGLRQDFAAGMLVVETGSADTRECTIVGTIGDDQLIGTEDADLICGLGGNDVIDSLGGDDTISGDGGDDTIYAGSGADTVDGGAGADTVEGGVDDDLVLGADGNDVLLGGDGDDRLAGEAGDDVVDGGLGADILTGGAGADDLTGGAGDDTVAGDEGDDQVAGEDGADDLQGGAGEDDLTGGDGLDALAGNDGDDHLQGGVGDDELKGGIGQDALNGGLGEDHLDGGPSGDTVNGGDDPDACVAADSSTDLSSCETVHENSSTDTVASYVTDSAPVLSEVDLPQPVGTELVVSEGNGVVAAGVAPETGVRVISASQDPTAPASPEIGIGLPQAAGLADGSLAADGTVVYEDPQGSVDVGVQVIEGDVRIATVINSADAPTRYDYPMTLPAGAVLQQDDAGVVSVIAADGSMLGGVSPAWAKDAEGTAVPTHYEIQGTTLTQVVDLSDPTLVYPVTADPFWGSYIHRRYNFIHNGVRYPTGYCARCYHNNTKISVALTSWGNSVYRTSIPPGAGQALVARYGWPEVRSWWPATTSHATINQQYACHVAFAWLPFAKTGASWDMELFRRSKPNWAPTIGSHGCNW
jgi:hypothetical protein